MKLHNRQIKASFWDDPDLLQQPRDLRWLFEGLWHLADDSGCLPDSPFLFKTKLFPSPVDADLTVEVLAKYRDKLVELGMLIPYKVNGKDYLFITHFHDHQTLRSPAPPTVPLPPWVRWVPSDQSRRSGTYVVTSPFDQPTDGQEQPYGDRTVTVQSPTQNPEPKNPRNILPPNGGPAAEGGEAEEMPKGRKSSRSGGRKKDEKQQQSSHVRELQQYWAEKYKAASGIDLPNSEYGRMGKVFGDWLKQYPVELIKTTIDVFFANHNSHSFSFFQSSFATWLPKALGRQRDKPGIEPARAAPDDSWERELAAESLLEQAAYQEQQRKLAATEGIDDGDGSAAGTGVAGAGYGVAGWASAGPLRSPPTH